MPIITEHFSQRVLDHISKSRMVRVMGEVGKLKLTFSVPRTLGWEPLNSKHSNAGLCF